MKKSILEPVSHVRIVDRKTIKPNNYNPNVVSKDNLKLLTQIGRASCRERV